MDFSEALRKLKDGSRITNLGWNGKGMCIFMQKGYPDGVAANRNTAEALNVLEGTPITVSPYIMMRNAQGALVPWLASQMDLFSEDWELVTEE